jgi:signal transduction histidine kinase
VSGATALLAGTRLDGEQRELVALLEAGTAHVVLIVEDILLHGALASGTFPVKREPLALAAAVLQPAWRMVSMQHAQRDKVATLRVTRTVDAAVPAVLLGDATRLTQVLTNLLGNSVKFTPAGGSIHLQVSVVTDDEDGAAEQHAAAAPEAASRARWLRFQVRDTGIGLAAGARSACVACISPLALLTRSAAAAQATSSACSCPSCRRSRRRFASTAARGSASRSVGASRARWAAT